MKKSVYIYGKRKVGKRQFVEKISQMFDKSLCITEGYTDLSDYNKEDILLMNAVSPEDYYTDELVGYINDFKNGVNKFNKKYPELFIITTWFNIDDFYSESTKTNVSREHFKKEFDYILEFTNDIITVNNTLQVTNDREGKEKVISMIKSE